MVHRFERLRHAGTGSIVHTTSFTSILLFKHDKQYKSGTAGSVSQNCDTDWVKNTWMFLDFCIKFSALDFRGYHSSIPEAEVTCCASGSISDWTSSISLTI